ncbi:hypothetical protein EGM92_28930, partial [Enterobacter cloacae]
PYVNLIVTREDNKDAENVKKFVQAYQSEEVYQEANKVFNGLCFWRGCSALNGFNWRSA